ncbi:hypothetical protein [Pseudoxanthomonas composti]|uniref:Uncharacterized protein n=1 Tax=Pseudoxanthomonas composti TaxID=2137479 RepID=A0A4Q1JVB8_9GAMM|nr:hypothetical protein [Pseudoxanthomonas composti]RXR06096.1 hypothetical protein EPA99_09665 [Pseudoxanthomonas composti]
MDITDFLIMDWEGDQILADPQGSNLAFCCFTCRGPVLAVALENQRGWDEEHPAVCRRCGAAYLLGIRPHAEKLYIHKVYDFE